MAQGVLSSFSSIQRFFLKDTFLVWRPTEGFPSDLEFSSTFPYNVQFI